MTDESFDGVTWHDIRTFGLGGMAWMTEDREQPFDRFPSSMREQIPESLWNLSTWPAGVYVDFAGAPVDIFARWRLTGEDQRDASMNQIARGGLDAYGRDGSGTWRWVGSQEPWGDPDCHGRVHRLPLDGKDREYRVYLPLMRRVGRCEIGSREPLRPLQRRRHSTPPIIYYGTSIVHGAGVGRPGMAHASQLGRLLDREVVNLGFCGRAWCEPAVAEAIGRIESSLVIIDPLPNNSPEEIETRLPLFVRTLRRTCSTTPLLFVEDRRFGDATFITERDELHRRKNAALSRILHELQAEGITDLRLAAHEGWYGDDMEGTTDGSHPNDLGAWRMATALLPQIRDIIEH